MKKLISLLLTAILLFICTFGGLLSASAEAITRTVSREVTLYEWDLTNSGTFWNVTDGTTTPLQETSGGGEHCSFRIDENGAYLQGLKDYPAYDTTGAASNVDMSDPSTKLVVEFEAAGSARVFIKASFDVSKPDEKGTLFERESNGYIRFEKNISTSESKFASLQLGIFPGGEVTFKTAKIIKTVTASRVDEGGAAEKLIKDFDISAESSEIEVNELTDPIYDENGLTMTAKDTWIGLNTSAMQLDVSDVSTKLVLDVTNNSSATLAIKYVSDNIFSYEDDKFIDGEIMLTSATGLIEVNLDKVFTKEQLAALSNGNIRFQLLIGSAGNTVTVHSLSLVKSTVPVFNKKINLSNPDNYWNFQGFPTSEDYISQGEARPLTGTNEYGTYILDRNDGTLSIKANQSTDIFWFAAQLNNVKIDINRNPKLKFNVVSSGSKWTVKLKNGSNEISLFDENNNTAAGEVEVDLYDYVDKLLPASVPGSGIIDLGINFTVLYNSDNISTVVKDLRIEYDCPDPIQQVTMIPETVVNTDTLMQQKLPGFITVASDDYTGDIHVNWICDTEFTPDVAGIYTFTGILDSEGLYNNGLEYTETIKAAVNVKEFMLGNVNNDGSVDILDLIRLKRYLTDSENTEIYFNAADILDDESINSLDLGELKKILLK